MSFDPSGLWPRGSTDLLLRAALHADPQAARDAFAEWSAAYDLDSAPWPEVRIAALVGARLPELGIETDLLPVMKGISRHIWAHAQSRFAAPRPLLVAFQEAGIPMLALKGFGRIVAEPALASRRYIGDIDILLRPEDWARAVDVADGLGWHVKNGWPLDVVKHRLRHRRHSLSFVGPTPVELDLHRFALIDNRCRDEDAGIWARAETRAYAQIPFMVPSPADRAVVACGHGAPYVDADSEQVDWLIDAAAAFAAPDMNWTIFQAEISRRALEPHALGALGYLAELGHDIPRDLLVRLAEACPEPVVEMLRLGRQGREMRRRPEFADTLQACEELRCRRACAVNRDWKSDGVAELRGTARIENAGRRFDIPVPAGIAPADRVELVMEITPGRCRPGERIVLDVDCLEGAPTRLGEWRAPLKGMFTRLIRRASLAVQVPAPLLVAREVDVVRARLRKPARSRDTDPADYPVAAIRYEWRVKPPA